MNIARAIDVLSQPHKVVCNTYNARTVAVYNSVLVSPSMLDMAIDTVISYISSQLPDMEEHSDDIYRDN